MVSPLPFDDWEDESNEVRALEHIRRIAFLHYFGGAFDPEHMRQISNLAASVLCGEEIPAPRPWSVITAEAKADWERLRHLFDDEDEESDDHRGGVAVAGAGEPATGERDTDG